jgi:hypothetical protein
VPPEGWREAVGYFGDEGSYVSVADIVDDESKGAVLQADTEGGREGKGRQIGRAGPAACDDFRDRG